ncbi:MAG: XRE family transcriptional regulator [Chloroflexi bacterium]|nr:MAG: XRE family transcriptional regulator [Chloroflexota bacterium]MBL1196810.1 helix-turn-helix domain-containing protein [Chloroflexota bacterium]NOH14105.1 helix-turn-helix domain-containing protein [Chloroflexota bacterium]
MKQPDIGKKVAELRQQKNMTQEELAEDCEVSTRTIQRIENGEVEPRAFTRNTLSTVLEFDFGQDNTENEGFWLAALHLSNIFLLVFIPLVLWAWKKNQSYEIDRQGRQVLNFQITMTLLLFGAMCFAVVFLPGLLFVVSELDSGSIMGIIGLGSLTALPFIFVAIFGFYQAVVNTMRALSDTRVHYPLSIQFLK